MMILGYRSNDAVITICQNNSAKSIEIVDVNKAAEACKKGAAFRPAAAHR
jgi:hypothetical protein